MKIPMLMMFMLLFCVCLGSFCGFVYFGYVVDGHKHDAPVLLLISVVTGIVALCKASDLYDGK